MENLKRKKIILRDKNKLINEIKLIYKFKIKDSKAVGVDIEINKKLNWEFKIAYGKLYLKNKDTNENIGLMKFDYNDLLTISENIV